MAIEFKKQLKIRDVLESYDNDEEMARAISRLVEKWDLKDPYTDEPIDLPEPDTSEWYKEVSFEQFTDLIDAWIEHRGNALPKTSGEQS